MYPLLLHTLYAKHNWVKKEYINNYQETKQLTRLGIQRVPQKPWVLSEYFSGSGGVLANPGSATGVCFLHAWHDSWKVLSWGPPSFDQGDPLICAAGIPILLPELLVFTTVICHFSLLITSLPLVEIPSKVAQFRNP